MHHFISSPIPPLLPPEPAQFVDIANNHTLLRYFQQVLKRYIYAENFGLALDDEDRVSGKPVFLSNLFVTPHLSPDYHAPEQLIRAEIAHQLDELRRKSVTDSLAAQMRLFILGDPALPLS